MNMAGHPPQRSTRFQNPDDLGEKDLDRGYDWDYQVWHHPVLPNDFWKPMKTEHPAALDGVHCCNS
jgi:hypothetical protein